MCLSYRELESVLSLRLDIFVLTITEVGIEVVAGGCNVMLFPLLVGTDEGMDTEVCLQNSLCRIVWWSSRQNGILYLNGKMIAYARY